MSKKGHSKEDSDTDDDVKKGKDKRFDGSQEPLYVSRMMTSLERYYKTLKLDAHERKSWSTKCTEEYLVENFIPPSILPKMIPEGSTEDSESF